MPRPTMDNVTFVNFGSRKKVDTAAETTTPRGVSEEVRSQILRFNEPAALEKYRILPVSYTHLTLPTKA